jgi:hypothetical protein
LPRELPPLFDPPCEALRPLFPPLFEPPCEALVPLLELVFEPGCPDLRLLSCLFGPLFSCLFAIVPNPLYFYSRASRPASY